MTDRSDELWHTLNAETAQIQWQELQKHYASGMVLFVEASLDLVDVAFAFAKDDKTRVQDWLKAERVGHVPDDMAAKWVEQDSSLWGVVVSPFVLVQEQAR